MQSDDPSFGGHRHPTIEKTVSDLIELNTESLASLQKDVFEISYAQSWAQGGLRDNNAELEDIRECWATKVGDEPDEDLLDRYVLPSMMVTACLTLVQTRLYPTGKPYVS